MLSLSLPVLVLFIFIISAVIALCILLARRLLPVMRTSSPPDLDNNTPPFVANALEHASALLLVQSGGRLVYMSQQAREWFRYWREEPNLEHLTRRVRPAENLLKLCAMPGRSTFSIEGQFYVGISSRIPYQSTQAMVIFIEKDLLALEKSRQFSGNQEAFQTPAFQIFTDINQVIFPNPDLEVTLRTVLEYLERVISADLHQIAIWDPLQALLQPYRLGSGPEGERQLEKLTIGHTLGQRYSLEIIDQRESKYVPNVLKDGRYLSERESPQPAFNAYLGVPLLIAGDPVGIFELVSLSSDCFSDRDVEIIEFLARQTAMAIKSAQIRDLEKRLDLELEGFEKLSQDLTSIGKTQDWYAELVHSLSKILDAEIIGFFIHDHEGQLLIGKNPFIGIQPSIIEWSRSKVLPDSEAARIVLSEEIIVSIDAPSDTRLQALELNYLALAAGIRASVLIPLISDRQHLGYLLVANKKDGSFFDAMDVRRLKILAELATPHIVSFSREADLLHQIDTLREDLVSLQSINGDTDHITNEIFTKSNGAETATSLIDQHFTRIQAVMDIAETVNHQADRSSVLIALGRGLIAHMEIDLVLLGQPEKDGIHLLYAIGDVPAKVKTEALLGQRNPLSYSLQTGKPIFVSRMESNEEWLDTPLLTELSTAAFICLPIKKSNGVDAVVLGIRYTPMAAFTSGDEHLFSLLSSQISTTLQNIDLLTETSHRLAEVNLLLDFTRQLGTLDSRSILQTFVESALLLIPAAQAGMIALWDARLNGLVPQVAIGYSNVERMLEVVYPLPEGLPGQVFQSGRGVRLDEVDFSEHFRFSAEHLLRYRDATNGQLPLTSLIIPVQKGSQAQPHGILVLENFQTPAVFSAEDQAMITSLARQTALALENTKLYKTSQERAEQLQALTRIAATITAKLLPDDLIFTLLEQLVAILPYDTGTLWLRQADEMVLRVARGFADSEKRQGLSVSLEDSLLLKEMIESGQPVVVGKVAEDQRFIVLDESQSQSWLGIPLIASGDVIGVIALEKVEPDFYTPELTQIAATFAGQAAVALENANLYQESLSRAMELDQRSQRLELLNRLSTAFGDTLEMGRILELALLELSQAITCSTVSALIVQGGGELVLQAELPNSQDRLPVQIPSAPLFDQVGHSHGVFTTEDVNREVDLTPLRKYFSARGTLSLLVLPLATGIDLHGFILVHRNHLYKFTADEIGLARTISNQTAIAIQNAQLYTETLGLTKNLEKRVLERTAELESEHQRTRILLRIMKELSASLDLDQILSHTLKVLNEYVGAEHIAVLIQRISEDKLYHLASVGYAGDHLRHDERITSLDLNKSLAGWIIAHRESVLIPDLLADKRWHQLPERHSEHRSAIGAPLMSGADAIGSILFFHRTENRFTSDHLDLVHAVTSQVAIAVNNTELYRLIRDQAKDLGQMLRTQQEEVSRSAAILEAVADGVVVTDSNKKIALFNASAERILDLKRSEVIGKSLEDFIGLFGGAAQSWMETIHDWSRAPSKFQTDETFAEQIDLEDGRVVSVHLAPVIMRDNFFGTVSVFRDITHHIELDRLKSEFVATVSHELRTPMTAIRGYVDILLMGAAGSLNEKQSQYLDIVKSNTERLTILVNDLLDISRLEAGRVTLSLQPLDLRQLAQEAVENLIQRSRKEQKKMKIGIEGKPDLPAVLGDRVRVRQILDNLLENAYCYTAENGRIILGISNINGEIQIDVQDDGIGIPPLEQSRVFERFYRGEHPFVLAISGTGLGLAIVQFLVEMHKGRIWVESNGVPGEGSTFSFTLPVYTLEQ